jgi:acyl-CoA synthetase (AMP-forming)/AMP-acid ligase II
MHIDSFEADSRSRPQVAEAAVVGVASEQWGQKVAAVIVLNPAHAQTGKGGKTWGTMDMRRALKEKLANYKIPQELKVVEDLPKNAMGKSESHPSFCHIVSLLIVMTVNKKSLVKEIFGPDA